MKGTLFTADFVKNADGALKLIEINTDTAIQSVLASAQLEWSELISVFTANSITDLHVVYKNVQKSIVDDLEQELIAGGHSITFNRHIEADNSIYPSAIEDASGKFILRLAYDQSALLDSNYAAKDLNVYKLFLDDNKSDRVPGLYYSGSESSEIIDTLEDSTNADNIADLAVRSIESKKGADLSFYKLGNTSQSSAERIAAAKSELSSGDVILTNYYVPSGATRASSVRLYQVVYGDNLDIATIGAYSIDAILDFPTALDNDLSLAASKIHNKHYSEFSVEGINRVAGITPDHSILRLDGGADLAPSAVVGDVYKSYFVNGAPDTDQYGTLFGWSHNGDTMPDGSFPTGSVLISSDSHVPTNNSVIKITLDNGDILRLGPLSNLIIHQASSNTIRYVYASTLVVEDSLFNVDGNKVGIASLDVEIHDIDNDATTYEFNLEDTDIFTVSGSSIIVHNSPCFIAGTEVTLSDGDVKSIEDVVVGDLIATYNHDEEEVEEQEVLSVMVKVVDQVAKIFTEVADITGTLDHPFYVIGKGYCSVDPAKTLSDSGLEVEELEVGDEILTYEGDTSTVLDIEIINEDTEVFNLDKVQGNHNFFANSLLVHNRYK